MLGARSEFFTNGRCDPKAFSPLAWSQEMCQESLAVILMRGDLGKRYGSEDGEMRYSGHLSRAVGQSLPKAMLPLPQWLSASCRIHTQPARLQASVAGSLWRQRGDEETGLCSCSLLLRRWGGAGRETFHLDWDPKGSVGKGPSGCG